MTALCEKTGVHLMMVFLPVMPMNRSYLFVLLASLGTVAGTYAQYALPIETHHSCSYSGGVVAEDLYEFAPSQEANQMIARIMGVMGLKSRFEIKAANVDNAAAVIYANKRYILYSQHFIAQLQQATHTDWAAMSILAHEIGHHLNGHTLEHGGSRPSNELEADEFSGFVLRKMGATLAEAQAAMRVLSDDKGSATHPPRSARLEAVAVGWKQADERMAGERIARNTPSDAPVTPVTEPVPVIPPIDRKQLVGRVVFHANPTIDYYLTTRMNLVKATPEGVKVIGKVMKSDRKGYLYMIENTNKNYVYLAGSGEIYNASQQKIGYAVDL